MDDELEDVDEDGDKERLSMDDVRGCVGLCRKGNPDVGDSGGEQGGGGELLL